jgi:aminobenzoyl-glutamate transport protein
MAQELDAGGGKGGSGGGGVLGVIEWLGNKLPDPVFLFLGATALVFVLSAIGSGLGWSVQPQRPRVVMQTVVENGVEVSKPKKDEQGKPVIELVSEGSPVAPRNMMSADGVYWLSVNMIRNFINFPPLGVVLVGMFGIGVAERVGLFSAILRWMARLVPGWALTPTIVFLGVVSNVASDAGYLVLPPLAAGLYILFKRPPLAGIAAAFAGVSAGFSANLLVGSTDALVGGITQAGARVLEPDYTVLATANWWFMAGSTFLLTGLGWAVTAWIVEPRLVATGGLKSDDPLAGQEGDLSGTERRALGLAGLAALVTVGVAAAMIFVPGAPLAGPMPAAAPTFGPIPVSAPANAAVATAAAQPRWSQAVVPLILVCFLVPGLVYGMVTGSIRSQADVSKAFIGAMVSMAPVIALAFFAAQFIASFQFSQLDRMLAFAGGKALVQSGLPIPALLAGVVVLTMTVNLLMSSMSAKWTVLAPILVPMLMMVGISPELTQNAYRVGDSVTNIVTPLNSYAIVILAAMQRHRKDAGMGNLIAMMVPYSVVFAIVWTIFLLGWVWLGIPIGPDAPMWYVPK